MLKGNRYKNCSVEELEFLIKKKEENLLLLKMDLVQAKEMLAKHHSPPCKT